MNGAMFECSKPNFIQSSSLFPPVYSLSNPSLSAIMQTISQSLFDSPRGSIHFSSYIRVLNCPPTPSAAISFSSNLVFTGNTISAKRQSFSSHGCWAKKNSILGPLTPSISRLPPFQQVIQQGESVHIMCISEQPSAGYLYFLNWFSRGSASKVVPYQVSGGLRIA